MSGLGQIILVAGPNGAGKTYFYRKFHEKTRKYTYVNADEIAKVISEIGLPTAQIDLRAGRAMLGLIRQSIVLGEDIMIETTLASANWARHIPVWRSKGYAIILFYLRLPSADAAVARVQRRIATGGHPIPEDVIRRRFIRSLQNLNSIYKSIVDQWYVFDSLEDREPVLAESWSG